MKRPRGATLLELCLAMGMLGLLMLLIFKLFDMGSGAFAYAITRQSLQAEARRLMTRLDADLRPSCMSSFTVLNGFGRRVSRGFHRDVMCFSAVKDWTDPNTFDAIEVEPKWDHYLVYYGTLEEPYGRVVRAVLEPPSAEIGGLPYERFTARPSDFLKDDFLKNDPVQKSARVVARGLVEFAIKSSSTVSGWNFLIRLRQQGREGGARGPTGEMFEITFDIIPENTKPRR